MTRRSIVRREQRDTCYRCRRPAVVCLCAHVTPLETRTRFVLLTHPMEDRKEKNGSGRAAHLSLTNSEIVVGVDFTDHPRVNALIEDPLNDCQLLYPGTDAANLSRGEYRPGPGKRPVLFLIDSTWPCAKKVMRLSSNLQGLPRLSFDNTAVSEFYIKQQPAAMCLSTVESLHRVLELFGIAGLETYGQEDGERLLRPFRRMIQMQIDYAADPTIPRYRASGGYRPPSERKPSLKHQRRNVV